MKLSVQPRPAVLDQDGNEVDLGKEILVQKTQVRLILSPNDIVPEGASYHGCSVEVETLGEHIVNLTREVLERGDVRAMKNFYWTLGQALRCVTSEENARLLIESLDGRGSSK